MCWSTWISIHTFFWTNAEAHGTHLWHHTETLGVLHRSFISVTLCLTDCLLVVTCAGVHHPQRERSGLCSVPAQRTVPVHQRAAAGPDVYDSGRTSVRGDLLRTDNHWSSRWPPKGHSERLCTGQRSQRSDVSQSQIMSERTDMNTCWCDSVSLPEDVMISGVPPELKLQKST